MTVRSSNGCEIRFVSDASHVRLYLRSLQGHADTVHLRGNHHVNREGRLEDGKIHCVQIDLPQLEPNRTDASRATGGFAPQVYRLHFCASQLAFHGVDAMGGNLRPPTAGEVPRRRWLAYGSSITQGGSNYYNYVNAAARMLEADPLNLGMSGSCFLEKQFAGFIASRDDWDFASFELGINMLSPLRDNARFAEKVNYLLDAVAARQPGKPVFLISIFDCGVFYEKEISDWQRDLLEKNDILAAATARHPSQVHLLDGRKLVPDFRGFHIDQLHPEPFAATRIGLALAEAMAPLLPSSDQT